MVLSKIRCHFGAAFLLGLAVLAAPASAQQAPTDAQMALARQIVVGTNLSAKVDGFVTAILTLVRQNIVRVRPEYTGDIDEIMTRLQVEFAPEQVKLNDAVAGVFASRMSEAEMKDVIAFFNSPSGKKYTIVQPQALDDIGNMIESFRRQASGIISERVRAEMKKKGHDL